MPVEALKAMGANLEDALEHVNVPSYVIDKAGVVRWMNRASRQMVGDRTGQQFTSVVAPEETRRARETFARKLIGNAEVTDGTFAVVDMNGDLVYFERMDGASPRAVTSSQGKARAALLFGLPTKDVQDAIRAGKPISVTVTNPAAGAWELTPAQGGLPVIKDGKVIAAIGCGGSLPANDEKFAQAGLNAMTAK